MCLLRGTDWIFIYRQFNIQQFYVLPTHCIYVFCVDLRTNSDYSPIQHWWIGFCNRDGEYLLRGTDWIFTYRQFNIQQFHVLPTQCIYVFCVDLRTDGDREISNFGLGEDEVFALQRCYAVYADSCSPTFGDILSDPAPRVRQSIKKALSCTACPLKSRPVSPPETCVNDYESTLCNVVEDWRFQTAIISLYTVKLFVFRTRRTVFTARCGQTPRLMCSGDALDDWMYQFDFTGQSCRPDLPPPSFFQQ